MNRPTERARTPFGDAARPPLIALVGILLGALYLWWRSSTVGSGSLLVLSIPFLVIEAWSLLELAFLTIQTWRLAPSAPRAELGRQQEPVDIAIVAAGVDADELERTLMACRAVRSRGQLIVIDTERRFRHRSLAADAGASYRIDRRATEAPGLAAHRNTEAPSYLWLRAGQLPTPDLIEVTGPRFDRQDMAVCQLATSLLNSDDLAHLGRERDDDGLVNAVLGPALSRWDAGLWLGSASVVRRQAIDDIGGFDRDVPIERLTARLHRSGWATAFERRHLVATTAPESIDHYLAQRRQRAGAALSVLASTDGPLMPGGSMGWRRRFAHLGAVVRFGTGVRYAALSVTVVAVLIAGLFPAETSALALVVLGGANAGIGALGRRAVARGSMQRGDWLHQGWRVIGAETAAIRDAVARRVRPIAQERRTQGATGGLASLAHLPLLDAVVLAVDLALLARAATILDRNALPAFATGQRVVAIGFAVTMLVPIVRVLQVTIARQQRRSHYRIPVALDATVDGSPAKAVDLTPDGAGILLPYEPAIGTTASLEITLPGADGLVRRIVGRAVIRSARLDGEQCWRAGLQLVQMAPAARQALVAFCAKQPEPEEAGGEEMVAVVDPAAAAELRRRRTVRMATIGAGVAGLATVIFGPGIASASTAEAGIVVQVCVVGTDGSPVSAVQVERLIGEDAQVLGGTDLVGCVDTSADTTTTGFAVTHRGGRYQVKPGDYRGTVVEVALSSWNIGVVDLDGEPVPEAEVRFFTDRWLPTVSLGEPGDGYRFDGLPVDPTTQQIEVRLDGARYVRAMGEATATTVVLSRVRVEPGEEDEIPPAFDRGRGWESLIDGSAIVPGPLVVRLADGDILRFDVPESNELVLPHGVLTPFELDLGGETDPGSTTSTTSASDPRTSTTVNSNSVSSTTQTSTAVTSTSPTSTGSSSTTGSTSTTVAPGPDASPDQTPTSTTTEPTTVPPTTGSTTTSQATTESEQPTTVAPTEPAPSSSDGPTP